MVTHQRLLTLVTNLRSTIPQYGLSGGPLLAASSMIEAAALILFQVFAGTDSSYRAACVKAATSILNPGGMDVSQLSHISPVMGVSFHFFIINNGANLHL